MKQEKSRKTFLIVQLLSLLVAFLLCIVATVGITLAYFGNTVGGVATITLRGGVYVGASFSSSTTSQNVVPGQFVNVSGIASVTSRGDSPTNAFLRAGVSQATHSSGDSAEVNVTNIITVDGATCHWERFGDWYYLCQGESGTLLFELDTTTHNSAETPLDVSFNASFQVNPIYTNDKSGTTYTVTLTFTAIQSFIPDVTGEQLVCTNEAVIDVFDSIV